MAKGEAKGQGMEGNDTKLENDELMMFQASMPDRDVIRYTKEGKKFDFNFEDFRELDGVVLDALDHDSLMTYFRELQLFRAKERREKDEQEYGKVGLIEVIGAGAQSRMRIEGLPEGLHGCWKLPEEVDECRRAGYVTVDGRFPDVKAGDGSTSGGHELKRKDGTVEAVLMAIPSDRHEQHLHGVSKASRKRVQGIAAKFQHKAQEVDRRTKTSLETHSERKRVSEAMPR